MTRLELPREDLLRDAVAFTRRVMLSVKEESYNAELFIGFRDNGCVSFYCDQDPVYQFNSNGELRRAFINAQKLESAECKLVALTRQRNGAKLELLREPLSSEGTLSMLQDIETKLDEILNTLQANAYKLVGHVPENENILPDVITWLKSHSKVSIADVPHAV